MAAEFEVIGKTAKKRDGAAVARALGRLGDAARGTADLMEPILEAVEAYATLGEVCQAMKDVFGEYKEPVKF